jgi:prophage maintenance system killer protein
MAVFLELNGLPLRAPEREATNAMLRLAADTTFAPQFREWVRRWVL